ncbi:DUF3131 domain-containing protein [Azotobacter beijerinckii]|uniref:DUF3131 domain-containing protein n=1 Tax=Azotobacter beijerinckii TaxID=170623 RepID=UPI002955319C|nr:DUF3131 domain-containing protein [Azotobacter beijerinckii]MDV7213395.1 DUF3131 domain-containing protein [Azotobacter beijerinckii]
MSFRDDLLKARSRIAFIVALTLAFPLVLYLDSIPGKASDSTPQSSRPNDYTDQLINQERHLAISRTAPLRKDQVEWAKIAWRYFEKNIDPVTGLANSTNAYPSTTMWDTGSFLLAVISAQKIGLIDGKAFDRIIEKALSSLEKLPLFDGKLPNKAYNTKTLSMVDYNNQPTNKGLGWSALDIARLFVPLTALKRKHPKHSATVDRVIAKWSIGSMLKDGKLYGALLDGDDKTVLSQEGRIGYEEYAAKALIAAGYDAFQAWRTDDYIELQTVEAIKVPSDNRAVNTHEAQVYTTSEPYVLDGLEFGFDTRSMAFSEQIYSAQEQRYNKTGILTAVSEGHINRKPNFVYSTVFGNGDPWAVLTDKGERRDELRFLSIKTVFAYDALYGTAYTKKMLDFSVTLNDPNAGWLEGYYELTKDVNDVETANTNAIILESIAFRSSGPILHP